MFVPRLWKKFNIPSVTYRLQWASEGKAILQTTMFREQLVGIAVDEVHMAIHW